MPRVARVLPALQLMRIALVFTAIADIWAIVLLTEALPAEMAGGLINRSLPLAFRLLCTAAVAAGLYVFGMSLNDLLDVRHDRTFAPQRPLPSGRISITAAVAIAVLSLLIGVLGSVPLGTASVLLTLAAAGLILFYNALGKYLPGVGIVMLGLVRAVHMLIAAPALGYCWPVWLTFSHVVGISAAAHRLEGKRPELRGVEIWIVVGSWMFGTLALIGWMSHRDALVSPAHPWLWVGPTVAAVVFLIVALRTARTRPEAAAGGLLIKRGLLWLIVYDAAWLLSGGLWWQAALLGAMLPAAMMSMWLIRRIKDLAEPPTFARELPQ